LFLARAFNDLAMAFHVLRAANRKRIGCSDYATVGLKK
jgi:hypothetical protein